MKLTIIFITFITITSTGKAQFTMPAFQAVQYNNTSNNAAAITSEVSLITKSAAVSGGIISSSSGTITSRGLCWGTALNPTEALSTKTINGTGTGTFSSTISNLLPNTVYYLRAYATRSNGTIYGDNVIFKTAPDNANLNYSVYAVASTTANNLSTMNTIIDAGTLHDKGILPTSILIDFTNKSKLTDAGVALPNGGDNFGLVVSGLFVPTETGTYRFTCVGDDAVDLFINGVNVVNRYGANSVGNLGATNTTGNISLTKDVKYSFRARMKENTVDEALRVYWKKPSQYNNMSTRYTWFHNSEELMPIPEADGNLNYQIYSTELSSPNSEVEMDAFIATGSNLSSGKTAATNLIDFNNAYKLLDAGITLPSNNDGFSLLASGYFVPTESGNYTFTCEGDDAVDLFINGVNVASHYGGHATSALGSHTGTITLSAGVKYSFKARMQENGGGESFMVYWKKPSQSSGNTWYQHIDEISSL